MPDGPDSECFKAGVFKVYKGKPALRQQTNHTPHLQKNKTTLILTIYKIAINMLLLLFLQFLLLLLNVLYILKKVVLFYFIFF